MTDTSRSEGWTLSGLLKKCHTWHLPPMLRSIGALFIIGCFPALVRSERVEGTVQLRANQWVLLSISATDPGQASFQLAVSEDSNVLNGVAPIGSLQLELLIFADNDWPVSFYKVAGPQVCGEDPLLLTANAVAREEVAFPSEDPADGTHFWYAGSGLKATVELLGRRHIWYAVLSACHAEGKQSMWDSLPDGVQLQWSLETLHGQAALLSDDMQWAPLSRLLCIAASTLQACYLRRGFSGESALLRGFYFVCACHAYGDIAELGNLLAGRYGVPWPSLLGISILCDLAASVVLEAVSFGVVMVVCAAKQEELPMTSVPGASAARLSAVLLPAKAYAFGNLLISWMSEPWAADAAYVYADRASVLGVWPLNVSSSIAALFMLGLLVAVIWRLLDGTMSQADLAQFAMAVAAALLVAISRSLKYLILAVVSPHARPLVCSVLRAPVLAFAYIAMTLSLELTRSARGVLPAKFACTKVLSSSMRGTRAVVEWFFKHALVRVQCVLLLGHEVHLHAATEQSSRE